MYVKVLYDKQAKKGLMSGHGFSCLIDGKILFDTADSTESLLENMKRLMVPPSDIEAVVISHDHWDHTGGLWGLLKAAPGLKVYACPGFSETFRSCVRESGGDLVVVDAPLEIYPDIFLAGPLETEYKGASISEQAVVVRGEKGFSVITGCAHFGIIETVKQVKRQLEMKDLYMVFGGFHLDPHDSAHIKKVMTDLRSLGVKKAGPTHCSGEKARRMFSGKFHDDFVAVEAGYIIQL